MLTEVNALELGIHNEHSGSHQGEAQELMVISQWTCRDSSSSMESLTRANHYKELQLNPLGVAADCQEEWWR
jgi:hypothetical protein